MPSSSGKNTPSQLLAHTKSSGVVFSSAAPAPLRQVPPRHLAQSPRLPIPHKLISSSGQKAVCARARATNVKNSHELLCDFRNNRSKWFNICRKMLSIPSSLHTWFWGAVSAIKNPSPLNVPKWTLWFLDARLDGAVNLGFRRTTTLFSAPLKYALPSRFLIPQIPSDCP